MNTAARYIMLSLDGVWLALPQSDVRALEAASDVESIDPVAGAIGWIWSGGGRRPVYCLDRELRPLGKTPLTRWACVLMHVRGQGSFGLLCDDVELLPRGNAQRYDLPPAMERSGTLLCGVLVRGDAVIALPDAAALASRLRAGAAGAADRGRRSNLTDGQLNQSGAGSPASREAGLQ